MCYIDIFARFSCLTYVSSPGSTVGQATREESISLIFESLNRVHKATKSVVTVIENMAGAGNIIGATFADLGDIVKGVEDKTRVGVCLDTCNIVPSCVFGVVLLTMRSGELRSSICSGGSSSRYQCF